MSARRIAAWAFVVCAAALLVSQAAAFVFSARVPWLAELSRLRLVPFAALAALVALAVAPGRAAALERLEAWLGVHRRTLAAVAATVAAAMFLASKVGQHLAFETGAFDLSMYHHAIDNTLHGRFMYAFGLEHSFFTEHCAPFLLTWVPFYALVPSVYTLLTLHALATAAAGVPLYLLARRHALGRLDAGLVTLAFWLSPILWRGFVFDVHHELWGPLFVFLALWAAHAGRWPVFYVALALLLSLKEDHPLSGLAIAVVVFTLGMKARKHAAFAAVLSVGWLAVALTVWPKTPYLGRYAPLGDTHGAVAWSLLSHPLDTLVLLAGRPVRALLGSLGAGAVLNPLGVLLAVPHLILNRASTHPLQSELALYYGLPAWTLVLATAPRVLAGLKRRGGSVLATCAALTLFVPATVDVGPHPLWWPTGGEREAAAQLTALDLTRPVSAQTEVVPHLPVTESVKLWRGGLDAPTVVLMRHKSTWPMPEAEHARALGGAADAGYRTAFENDAMLVFRRD
ncbi:MAG: DUF2079 domain-containing protein [Archangiaceae bacterium]|nr:DUF2079 domain-containing protein [Archangiaceae bacterium]